MALRVTVEPDERDALAALDVDRPASDDPDLDGGEDTPTLRRRRRETGVYVYRRSGRTCLRCGSTIADDAASAETPTPTPTPGVDR